jgi:hypothetical protein
VASSVANYYQDFPAILGKKPPAGKNKFCPQQESFEMLENHKKVTDVN